MRNILLVSLASALLSACSSAGAATVDVKNDVHCSILAFYFHGLAKHERAPEDQIRATRGLHDWYAEKARVSSGRRFSDLKVMQAEVEPILETIKADPNSMRDEYRGCADRAASDPQFDRFARSYMP